jgi:hypothetical protein
MFAARTADEDRFMVRGSHGLMLPFQQRLTTIVVVPLIALRGDMKRRC